jgi:hypothetical protein
MTIRLDPAHEGFSEIGYYAARRWDADNAAT